VTAATAATEVAASPAVAGGNRIGREWCAAKRNRGKEDW
jgi:hypothetical protein